MQVSGGRSPGTLARCRATTKHLESLTHCGCRGWTSRTPRSQLSFRLESRGEPRGTEGVTAALIRTASRPGVKSQPRVKKSMHLWVHQEADGQGASQEEGKQSQLLAVSFYKEQEGSQGIYLRLVEKDNVRGHSGPRHAEHCPGHLRSTAQPRAAGPAGRPRREVLRGKKGKMGPGGV